MKIGFIGLGIMGCPMVKNLIKANHELYIYDIDSGRMNSLTGDGATPSSVEKIASVCETVITMLPNSPHVKDAVCGEHGLLRYSKPGLVLIDMSSIAPLASQEISKRCAEVGVRMLEAPVSGGEPKAIDGSLSIMCGGERELFDDCLPILKLLGRDIVYCGASGAGNTVKLANQIIVASNIAALSEGLMLAKKVGVDPETVFEAIKGGLAGSTVMNAKAPMMISGNTKPGFKVDLHIKDLNNAVETGHALGSPLPLTSVVMEMLQYLRANGMGQCDHSSIAKYYEAIAHESLSE